MFDDNLRDTKETIFVQLAQMFRLFSINPFWLTAVGLVFGILAAIAITQQQYLVGLILWWLNRIFDGLDGTVARDQNLQSDLGGYVDILADFLIYALIPISLVYANPTPAHIWSGMVLLASFYINGASWMYLSAILEKRKSTPGLKMTSVEMPAGLVGGAETIVFYSAFILLAPWLVYLFVIMTFLVTVTILQRLIWAVKNLDASA